MSYSPRMDTETIIAARKARGHTQTDAANELGVTLRTWQRWEWEGPSDRTPEIMLRALREYVESAPAK